DVLVAGVLSNVDINSTSVVEIPGATAVITLNSFSGLAVGDLSLQYDPGNGSGYQPLPVIDNGDGSGTVNFGEFTLAAGSDHVDLRVKAAYAGTFNYLIVVKDGAGNDFAEENGTATIFSLAQNTTALKDALAASQKYIKYEGAELDLGGLTVSAGTEITIAANVTLKDSGSGKLDGTLTVLKEAKLTIDVGVSPSGDGTIKVESGGTLSNLAEEDVWQDGNVIFVLEKGATADQGGVPWIGNADSDVAEITSGSITMSGQTEITVSGNVDIKGDYLVPAGLKLTLSADSTLTVKEGVMLTIDEKAVLQGSGTITVEQGGALINLAEEDVWQNGSVTFVVKAGATANQGGVLWIGDDSNTMAEITSGSISLTKDDGITLNGVVTVKQNMTISNPLVINSGAAIVGADNSTTLTLGAGAAVTGSEALSSGLEAGKTYTWGGTDWQEVSP
ncbi:MAG: hypothetical protein LBK56_08310, partial [Gracilibacteraceae bacterium]|nr:hypothetical protein [Gracilibacteraceae bacterium]